MNNQTDPNDLINISPSDLGTGIFLIPDVQSERFGAMTKVFVSNISYPHCVHRGYFAFTFKWVPHTIATESELRNSNCSAPCVQTCVVKGCICNHATGLCE